MNGLMDIGQPAAEHHWLWQEPGGPQLYLLLCDGARVTLRSQQIRAMNLAWALRESNSSSGGSGGLLDGADTAAAADVLQDFRAFHNR